MAQLRKERSPKIGKASLSVAGEFAVASELCRRNIFAQPTFGNQKRTDLLILNEDGQMWRVEVKSKQGSDWPQCKGIAKENSFLIFVDFENKCPNERPDFYVLSFPDWKALCVRKVKSYTTKHPDRRAEITPEWFVRFLDEKKNGRVYEGMGVNTNDVIAHKDAWEKIKRTIGSTVGHDGENPA